MFVSFLVPIYNVEKYLKKCIDSILIQTGCPFEIILIDDGSTDSCPDICDQYQSTCPDIVRVIHKENEGLLLTRRRGFKEAKGDWFICIDSDDYIDPQLLSTVVDTINHYKCDMVMYNYCYIDDCGNVSGSKLNLKDGMVYEGKKKQLLYEERMTTTNINNMWLRAIHRDIVDIEADYSGIGLRNMCEDAVQVLPLYTNTKKTVYIDKVLYYYRKGNGCITSKATLANWKAIHRSFKIEQDYAVFWKIPHTVEQKRYTKQLENICNCLRWMYRNGRDFINMPMKDALISLEKDSMFDECVKNFDKKFLSTRYNRISVPIITFFMKKRMVFLLEVFFKLEDRVQKI